MAYSVSNPPARVWNRPAGGAIWLYVSADAEGSYDDAGYITNAGDLGMASGDIVLVIDTTTPTASIGVVTVSSGAGTLAALTAIA